MTIASRILMTAGENVGAAPDGTYYLYIRDDGVVMKVDSNASQTIVGRDGSQIPSLGEITNVDATSAEIGHFLTKVGINSFAFTPPIAGPQGDQGDQGIQGITGDTGDEPAHEQITTSLRFQNPNGSQGTPTDLKGDTGVQGLTGERGPKGDTGDQGIQGIQGEVGPIGVTGDQGIQGEVGPIGVTGDQGIQGEIGPIGVTGDQGIQGEIGVTGSQGDQGIQGITGERGPIGDTGAQGVQGVQGAQGIQGTQGTQGIQGLKGDLGNTGARGDRGEGFHVDDIGNFSEGTIITIETSSDATTYDKYLYLIEDDNRLNKTTPIDSTNLSSHLVSYDGIQWFDYGLMAGVKGASGMDGVDGNDSQDQHHGHGAPVILPEYGDRDYYLDIDTGDVQKNMTGPAYGKITLTNTADSLTFADAVKFVKGTTEIIIDNTDSGFNNNGSWSTQSSTLAYNGTTQYGYSIGSYATWDYDLGEDGSWEIFIYYPTYSTAADNVEIKFESDAGEHILSIDQSANGSGWYSLGSYNFSVGAWTYIGNIRGNIGDTGIQGVQGEQGIQGVQGATGSTGPQGNQGVQGITGDRGPIGDTGVQGIQGTQGIQGVQGDQGVKGDTGAGMEGVFYASNQTWQSHNSLATLEILQDNVLRNFGTLFTHSDINSPEEITVNFTGQVEVAFKVAMGSNYSNRSVTKAYASKNWNLLDDSVSYTYIRNNSSAQHGTCVTPSLQIPVVPNDVIRIHTQIATDGTYGDTQDVYTMWGESTLTLKGYVD